MTVCFGIAIEWYHNEACLLDDSTERRQAVYRWLKQKGYALKEQEKELLVHKLPLSELWQSLEEADLKPYQLIKWVAGASYNPLMKEAEEMEAEPERFYALIKDAPIEMGYVQFPEAGEESFDGSHGVEVGENVVDLGDTIHSHHTCAEHYFITRGRLSLRVDIENAKREENAKAIPARYEMDVREVNLDLDNLDEASLEELVQIPGVQIFRDERRVAKALGYTTQADSQHILTYVGPGTKLILVKTPTENWSGEGKWSDKKTHSCEKRK